MNIELRLSQSKALWIVLVLNAALVAGFFAIGLAAHSSSRVANGLNNVSDVLVLRLGTNWPDLLVSIVVAGIAAKGGIEILRDAHKETHEEDRVDAVTDTDTEDLAR